MKKLIAIYLLAIHLFNIGGQLVLHEYLIYQSDKFFNEQVGKSPHRADGLMEVKIPANMPNVAGWNYYQNLAGQVQFKNSAYNYVKIRIIPSAIYLLCVPNTKTTHLCKQNIINARQITDIPVPKKDHVPLGKLNLVTYSCPAVTFKFSAPTMEIVQIIHCSNSFIVKSSIDNPGQPPDQNVVNS